jgi:hypothetical protein
MFYHYYLSTREGDVIITLCHEPLAHQVGEINPCGEVLENNKNRILQGCYELKISMLSDTLFGKKKNLEIKVGHVDP